MKRHIPLVVGALAFFTATAEVARAWLQDSAHRQVAAKIHIQSDARWQSVREKLSDVSTTMHEQENNIVALRENVAALKATVRMLTYGQRYKARSSIGSEEESPSHDARISSARRHVKLSELVPPEEMPAPPADMVQSTVKGLYDDD